MKNRSSIILALAIVLMTSLACTIGGTALSTEVVKEPTPGSEQTNPVATTVPAQEAGGNDPAAGPETIDLTNPALYIVPSAPAFKFESTIKYTGVDTTGVAKEVSEIGLAEVQTQPQTTQRFSSSLEGYVDSPGTTGSINILSSDTVIIGDQMTSAQMVSVNGAAPELFCNTGLASEVQGPSLLESTPKIQEWLIGQAPRVESGIQVNEFVSDKYELSGDTLQGGDGLVSAYVYVARDGGFITRFELQSQGTEGRFGFDPTLLTDISRTYNYFLVEDGSLQIANPAECN
ncbi:MAG: hypothetical protein MUO23_08820 [Anaerolineales bacterium]|nr:hypothetical protein [Anaerolineales bacterium]